MQWMTALLSTTMATASKKKPAVGMHWFRKGLRLHDNPGLLSHQSKRCENLYPVFVMDGDAYQLKHCTALRANFLVEGLQDLDANLRELDSRLFVGSGDPVEVLPELWENWGITYLTWEKDETGEPYALERDTAVLEKARECGIEVKTFASETLRPLEQYMDMSHGSPPGTMGTFQTLFGKCGKVAKPFDAPKELPPPVPSATQDDAMLPPKSPLDLPYPRGIPKNEATPLWGPDDCENTTPIARGGETHALRQLRQLPSQHPRDLPQMR